MRFATVIRRGRSALHVEVSGGFAEVPAFSSVMRDVRDLLTAGPAALDRIREWAERQPSADPLAPEDLELAPPVLEPRAIVCVGRNYPEHVLEGRTPMPTEPVLFAKYPNSLAGPFADVVLHELTAQLDYEGELAFVVGKTAYRVDEAHAMDYVAGYFAMNDISARDLQLGDVQWIRGKSLNTFAPCGPVFVTADEIADVDAIEITTSVNGEVRQHARCGEMMFKIPEILAFITEGITLEPGDVVATGTPSGTAFGMTPPVYLGIGDSVAVNVSGVGTLLNRIVAAPAR